jgi:hypothetical protein
VEPVQVLEQPDQRSLRGLKNAGKIIYAQGDERCDHRQASERSCRPLPGLPASPPHRFINSHLVIFRQLVESEPASTDALGDDALQTDRSPAADEEDVGRVEGNGSRRFLSAFRSHNGDHALEHLEHGLLDVEHHVLGDAIKTRHLTKTRYPSGTGASMLLILSDVPITEHEIQKMARSMT